MRLFGFKGAFVNASVGQRRNSNGEEGSRPRAGWAGGVEIRTSTCCNRNNTTEQGMIVDDCQLDRGFDPFIGAGPVKALLLAVRPKSWYRTDRPLKCGTRVVGGCMSHYCNPEAQHGFRAD